MTLDALLAKHGLSERALARHGGPPPTTLRAWRQGRRVPRHATLQRIAHVLGEDVETVTSAAIETIAKAHALREAAP